MSATLVRKAVGTGSLKKLTEDAMMADISAILGYKVADEAIVFARAVAIMHEHGIEPFDPKRVAEYKEAEAKKLSSKKFRYYQDQYGEGYRRTTTVKGIWERTALEKYTKPVPAFALLRAAELKKAFNYADIPSRFYVEELRSRRRVHTVNLDPFMVLEVCGKRLYIDVWDEPKFEGRRTK